MGGGVTHGAPGGTCRDTLEFAGSADALSDRKKIGKHQKYAFFFRGKIVVGKTKVRECQRCARFFFKNEVRDFFFTRVDA